MNKICLNCNKEFNAVDKYRKYCSPKCYREHKSKNTKIKNTEICPVCGLPFVKNYPKAIYCSKACRFSEKGKLLSLEKQIETNKSLYGTDYGFQNEEVKQKIKETCLKKYGVDHISKLDEVKEKRKITSNNKYGVDYPTQSLDIKEKIKLTNQKKYKVDYGFQNEEIKKKIKETYLKKYGVDHPNKNEIIKEKIKNTCLKKYGVPVVSQKIKEVREKVIKTSLEKFNVINSSQTHITNYENYNEDYIKNNFIKDGYFLSKEFTEYFNIRSDNSYAFKKKFNITENNKKNMSKPQEELVEYIKSIYNKNIITDSWKLLNRLELDLYLPEENLAIEFNGLMFHSYGKSQYSIFNNYKDEKANKHLKKTELCEDLGIQLLQIFGDEWDDPIKQDIWKSILTIKLNLSSKKINARDCILQKISNKEASIFLKNNHLQGYKASLINYGLYHNNELVYVMTFGKSRFNKNYNWELIRACSLKYTIIRGGFSKLLTTFKKEYKGSIISYGNRRWTYKNKNVYKNNLINISKPNYFYFNPKEKKLYSRQQFQKHKLKNKLEIFDANLSETENMYNNGYRKIYDCGNLVYEL